MNGMNETQQEGWMVNNIPRQGIERERVIKKKS